MSLFDNAADEHTRLLLQAEAEATRWKELSERQARLIEQLLKALSLHLNPVMLIPPKTEIVRRHDFFRYDTGIASQR